MIKKPELLAPAGSLERLKIAFKYGADACYFGGEIFSLRAAAQNFSFDDMVEAKKIAVEMGKKLYCAVNVMPRNDELDQLPSFLKRIEEIGIDAVVVSDMGVLALVKEHTNMEIHISTQASTVNYKACELYGSLGAKRVVLARELSMEEIAKIGEKMAGKMDIEAFVHGAMCISYSGRCLLSSVMTGRDANRGACAQPCRWKYYLVEEKRPNEYYPVFEDENGTYIMNSKDLCMVEHVPALIKAGVTSFKIEGRVKTEYYVASVVNAYRRAIDEYFDNIDNEDYKLSKEILDDVKKISHRHYYTGFYFGNEMEDGQVYETSSYIREDDVVAIVDGYDEATQTAYCTQKNRFYKGDTLEVLSWKDKTRSFVNDDMRDERDNPLEVCQHPTMKLKIKVPFPVEKDMMIRKEKP